jgi:hypothetical protein
LRLKLGMAADGADLSIRAMKAGNAAGAKGQNQYGDTMKNSVMRMNHDVYQTV